MDLLGKIEAEARKIGGIPQYRYAKNTNLIGFVEATHLNNICSTVSWHDLIDAAIIENWVDHAAA